MSNVRILLFSARFYRFHRYLVDRDSGDAGGDTRLQLKLAPDQSLGLVRLCADIHAIGRNRRHGQSRRLWRCIGILPFINALIDPMADHADAKRPQPYHEPRTVDQLTAQNVKAIAEMEDAAQAQQSIADRVADRITRFCGSMPFVWVHVVWFTVWILGNAKFSSHPVDPYPFNFLTLVVSLEAIFLSTFIMISGNRQERINERRNHLDLQINLLAEQENTKTLKLLEAIANKLGIDSSDDPDVEVLEQATRPEMLIAQIDESIARTQTHPSSS